MYEKFISNDGECWGYREEMESRNDSLIERQQEQPQPPPEEEELLPNSNQP